MPYRHDTRHCFAAAIGEGGLSAEAYESALAETAEAIAAIAAAHDDGSVALLRLPGSHADLAALAAVAERLRTAFDDIVVLGTGGSSLGGQTLYALVDRGFGPPAGTPRLHFMDNVDPDSFAALFGALELRRTGVIAISKSGGTAETLTQLLVTIDAFRATGDAAALDHRVVVITEPRDSPMRRLGLRHGFETLDHDPGIGGRFSALSLVGLLPAMIAGLDAQAVRDGAASVLDALLAGAAPSAVAPAQGAAIAVALSRHCGVTQTVLMPYLDRLAHFGLWYRQLWAESLGKGGMGTTPIRAMGTVDQHSQLQLYLGGPRDKMFTVLGCKRPAPNLEIPADLAGDPALDYLAGRMMGELLDAERRATAATLAENGRPVRLIGFDTLDERTMGALMMHFMLETMIAAHLLGVDAFDQPAVEQGKILARRYLAGETAP
jgi:glucose-6-phosphate isomerase